MKTNIILIIVGIISQSIMAQDKVSFNNRHITTFETIEATISHKTLSLAAFKYELREGHPNNTIKGIWQDNVDTPKNMSIMFDVEFPKGFKFPIKPEDSVFLSISNIQEMARSKEQYMHLGQKMEAAKQTNSSSSEGQMQAISKEMKALAERYKKGEIGLEEMSRKQQILTQRMTAIMDGSAAQNPDMNPFTGIENLKDRTYYTVHFDDIPMAQSQQQATGYVYIKTFNTKEAVIEFTGTQEANCYDNPSLYGDDNWEEKCRAERSRVTGKPIRSQGMLKGSIRVKIRDFQDHRN